MSAAVSRRRTVRATTGGSGRGGRGGGGGSLDQALSQAASSVRWKTAPAVNATRSCAILGDDLPVSARAAGATIRGSQWNGRRDSKPREGTCGDNIFRTLSPRSRFHKYARRSDKSPLRAA